MGFLKEFKDMKQSVEAAPAMLAQARALGAQGQQLAAARQAAAAQPSAGSADANQPGQLNFEPIVGLDVRASLPAKIDRQNPLSVWLELAGAR